jgi:hypothetical protein
MPLKAHKNKLVWKCKENTILAQGLVFCPHL